MSEIYQGSCLCGEIQFEIRGHFDHFFLCHCGHCRKDTGSAHAANLFSQQAKIHWISGREYRSIYTVPTSRHSKSFCKKCGSAIPTIQLNGKLLVVPAGCLDSEINIKPTGHIYWASKGQWDKELDDIPRFDGGPEPI